ncbi:polyphosphate kinase 1 [Amphibacillus sediminis]|uniref:polyphosphate kinase 1 n=1 Tax=Amphibacillus sediminis TaxID=360185 RepID=UPI0009F99F63|nr:polyphosphate kinase 1 [Amphibacillus sediminis]
MKHGSDPNQKLELPSYFYNREVSWLRFNQRVLEEALDSSNPLLERLRFISIFCSNLDEFFMVRVARLKQLIQAGVNQTKDLTGLTPSEQLSVINEEVRRLIKIKQNVYRTIDKELRSHHIKIQTIEQLTVKQKSWLADYFNRFILPVLTPVELEGYQTFPLFKNGSLNILVTLMSKKQSKYTETAIVQIPAFLNRFIQISHAHCFILLEEVITYFMDCLFIGYSIKSTILFRITRDASINLDQSTDSELLIKLEKELKRRQWGKAVRLEVVDHSDVEEQNALDRLKDMLELDDADLFFEKGPLDLSCLNSLYQLLEADFDSLSYQALLPQPSPEINFNQNLFDQIRQRDILLHHPYESFSVVTDWLRIAAHDPKVLAIKQTLYRVSDQSPIIDHLRIAAQNGKDVTVLVELKARFDEGNNLHWAKVLSKAGCRVIYGHNDMKTHSKVMLFIRKENQNIQRYVHLSTGNYNDHTAKLYTDISLLSAQKKLVEDVSLFFDFLTGHVEHPTYHHLTMSPHSIRLRLITLIEQEIKFHQEQGNGHIIAKINGLTDKPLIEKLYQASQAGVKIDLIVRGICCLKPKVPGLSKNIRVRSIVGRFLEHSRIYYFHHGGVPLYYLSSADMMTRNMTKRIELLFPVLEQQHQKRIQTILDLLLLDNTKARELDAEGNYHYVRQGSNPTTINSQLELFHLAYQGESVHEKPAPIPSAGQQIIH